MTDDPPNFTSEDAARIAHALFGARWSAQPLPSERDQNFHLAGDNGEALVLKIANGREEQAVIEAQQRAMEHVARTFDAVPHVRRSLSGDAISRAIAPDGREHMVWAITRLAGEPLGNVRRQTPRLHRQLGETVARLTHALSGFDDATMHREFAWDLRGGAEIVRRYRPLVADDELAGAIDTLIARFDEHTAPRLGRLGTSATHNDLNDYNVLVDGSVLDAEGQRVSGIVDFGDMLHGYTVGDLAIAAAYVVLDSPDPLSALWEMARGHHAIAPLTEDEMGALFGLLALRLCMSACLGAHQQALNPANSYLGVSQAAIRRTLPRLARIPFAFAEATVRDACFLEPIASSTRVREWLAANTETFAPVLGVDLRSAPSLVLDLSVGGPLVHGDVEGNTEVAITPRVFSAMRAASVSVAVGRYDESRLLYVAPFFAAGDGTSSERRTIHVGLDLFAEAGTPVFAPLDGVVHLFGEHPALQDYGAVIVLRHLMSDGTEFFTLYGHLSHASLVGLREGMALARGTRIGTLGAPEENGGWTPHLHLQVITNLMGLGSDFPGVGTASRRAVWRSISPDANLVAGVPARRFPPAELNVPEILARRRAVIGPSVSIAYREPVSIARGWRQYMYDTNGRRYLDAYNNVPHVGHAHPRVVDAVANQMSVLSTNTRYLHSTLERYAERLVQTLPDPLRVCFLLNSASEANELALRLARAYTERRDMLVLEAAYHGNTTSLVDISPYKHAGPGGAGAPEWVHVAPLPDDYRGAYKRDDPDAGAKYARDLARVIEAMRADRRQLAAFIAESCPSVGGQLFFPPGYLAATYEHVRAAGGLCIADEVQTGLGRIGTHFWAFEAQQVVPDIVVMGKPLGNGHPLAAVVTTRAIADAFDNGMEFFSTFGGNTVSCAAGLAVLDVMRDEDLQSRALRTGSHLLSRLRPLVDRYEIVGDVRGSGLFLGIELVRDRRSLEPAGAEASYVANRMREEGILLGTDGPHHNVVKIRPPMPFDVENADLLVDVLDRVLGELTA